MTFGSLFAGIGGLDLGLERAGMECRWQVEIDPFCRQVLTKHWPKVPKYGDITKLTGNELESVDLICGGFPCQDLSQAGKRTGIEGSRSGLWFDFARIVGVARPRYVLIENVPGLLVPNAMRRVVGELAGFGYVGLWRSLRASEFGASHLRKRIFIVAYRQLVRSERDVLAYGASGGFGELRKPSGSDGLIDRRDTELPDAAKPRSDRATREEQRLCGSPSPAARFSNGDGSLEDTGRTGNWWPTEPPGLDRARPSGHDCGTSGTLENSEQPTNRGEIECQETRSEHAGRSASRSGRSSEYLADAQCAGLEIGDGKREQPLQQDSEPVAPGLPAFAPGNGDRLADSNGNHEYQKPQGPDGQHQQRQAQRRREQQPTRVGADGDAGVRRHARSTDGNPFAAADPAHYGMPFAPGPADPRWPAILAERPDLAPALESPVRGMADGLPDRLDRAMRDRTKRLGRLGNAVVPQIAEWIGRRILEKEAR